MDQNQRSRVEDLLRGISTGHVETVRDAWVDLCKGGTASVPDIKDKLNTTVWQDIPRGPVAKYLGVLLSLLDEVDHQAFECEINRLIQADLHPLHRKTVELLSQRLGDRPTTLIGPNIPVFVSPDLDHASVIAGYIEKWSRTQGLDLDCVTRVDVIARHPDLSYLGRYNLFFSGIVLTWPTDHDRGLALWLRRLGVEKTFYHEVGHHFHRHKEGGQVKEQEREANAYARSMLRRAHLVLFPLLKLVFSVLKFVQKRPTK